MAGDERAFLELTEPHRRELEFHCYRMLGSRQDAEDVLQETMVAAWRGMPQFEQRASVRTWLYRIATNRCLNAIRDAGRRPPIQLPTPFAAPPATREADPGWLEPFPEDRLEGIIDMTPGPAARYESREAVELAFIAALQLLTGRQRAALILHDVLGFRLFEVAAMLDTTEDGVKGALKRARATLDDELALSDRENRPQPESPEERELVERFVDALVADDIERLITLLTDRAWLTMPPGALEYQGPANIGAFLAAAARWRQYLAGRVRPAPRANGQPAFAVYRENPERDGATAVALVVLALSGTKVARITWFLGPDYVAAFGLPVTLDA